ncbi:hypothetical protein BJ970_004148 [Saccharopolyspora phatthalungensis]|uniref:Uncharacterized protein n=1 Tax=Saccharopolyspora phatthalungensis TaxID=664693 RepID=A0A840Q7E8_9PSEU|nr:hypothetical protein [Saccharopolyspora phatthalungensis]
MIGGLPVRTPGATIALPQARTPVAWFLSDDTDPDPVLIWVDHHRTAHERDPARRGWTLCGMRVIGGDAPTHAQVSVVGCRDCAAHCAARRKPAALV